MSNKRLNINGKIIIPFDIDDEDLKKCFCFFLYKAPNIDAESAPRYDFSQNNMEVIGGMFSLYKSNDLTFKKSCTNNTFDYEGLLGNRIIKRRILCVEKKADELEVNCILRHLRNSIAHGRVYEIIEKNRIWILFEDLKRGGGLSARILRNKKDILNWKREIQMYNQ